MKAIKQVLRQDKEPYPDCCVLHDRRSGKGTGDPGWLLQRACAYGQRESQLGDLRKQLRLYAQNSHWTAH